MSGKDTKIDPATASTPALEKVAEEAEVEVDQRPAHPVLRRNGWIRFWTAIANYLGYQKLTSLSGFLILGGALFGFSLARMDFWNPSHYLKNFAPGEAYWFKNGTRKVGLLLHLGAILPCGVLLVFQFVPKIRQKYILYHRINGYTVLTLLLIGIIGALMVTRHAFGGEVTTQASMYTLVVLVVGSACLGYYNIKRLQIEQHRKWMIRMAVYLGSIITIRIVMIVTALLACHISEHSGESYTTVMYCDEINYALDYNATKIAQHGSPDCINAAPNHRVIVPANMKDAPVQVASALRTGFAVASWLSIIIHIVAVEIYLNLTPNESHRLRAISYQKQLEGGMKRPGSAGLTSDKLGDAPPYHPPTAKQ